MSAAVFTALIHLSACADIHNPRVPEAEELAFKGALISGEAALRLSEGRRLYMNECETCHWRKWPDELDTDDWKKILTRHRGRVAIDDGKYSELADYVLRVSYCFQSRKCSLTPEASH